MRGLALLVTLCAGCAKDGDSAGPTPPAPVPSDQVDCGDTAPSVDSLVIADNGFYQCEQETWPSILLTASTSDVDGDLTYYSYRLWWDTTVDGFVDTAENYLEIQKTLSDEDCAVGSANLSMILCVTGNPPYATEVEFGVIVVDEAGNESDGGEPAITVFTTPDANGNY